MNAKLQRIAVIGPHNRGRISRHAHQPGRGYAITHLCGHSPNGLESYAGK